MSNKGKDRKMRAFFLVLATASLSACASGGRQANPSVLSVVEPTEMQAVSASQASQYRIGAADKLALQVFQVPDLSFEEIFVDAGGYLQLPLLGPVKAEGLTVAELADQIEAGLREKYLQDPQVMVTVAEAASQKVTVDGAVTKPGVYEMRGHTTLLQAVAMAEGPTRIADLSSVAVFRTVEDRPMVAVFDLRQIRNGQVADPVILGDDIVVVDTSRLSARMQDILQALPSLASFVYYAR